jgi:hypothetical protein
MSFNEFNNLTQTQFDDYVRQGMILLNRQTNGQPERIGWVEIGRSHASFYYQSCSGGKRPVSEHYFDIQEFAFNNRTVIGEGSEIEPTEALTPIGNFDPNIANNLGVIRPGFEPLNLTDYIRFAMIGTITNTNGESIRINDLSLTDQTRPTQVSLLMANRLEHFDNQFANEVSVGKWGVIRRVINESIRPGIHIIYPRFDIGSQQNSYTLDFGINNGNCLETSFITNKDNTLLKKTEISTDDLLKKLIDSFNQFYPNFKYNPFLTTEEPSVVNLFTEDFPEMDSFKQSLTYRYQQDMINSDMDKLLKKLDEEIKGIKSTDISYIGGDEQNV